tara:strand:+ start:1459 stop:2385 length:927 start_codon:yes stop_codon:yes gene_type:complete
MSRFSDTLKKGFDSENRKSRRLSRVGYLDYCSFKKNAQEEQHGILQHFRSENRGYPTRDQYHTMRGVPSSPSPGQTPSDGSEVSRLYGVNPQHEDSELIEMNTTRSLSTRYSPDRIGVQARRVSDGVWQDPYTNRMYDYNDGFKTESGEEFPGGHVALQSHMIGLASHLDSVGLYKEADYLDNLIKKKANSRRKEDVLNDQDLELLYKLYAQREGIPYDPEGLPPEQVAEVFRGMNRQSPLVRELLNMDSGDAIMFEPDSDAEPPDAGLRPEEKSWFEDDGPLTLEERISTLEEKVMMLERLNYRLTD